METIKATEALLESLKEIMEDSGLNVDRFAEKIECNPSAVRRWLYKLYFPEPETLIKIATEFHISVDYLFGFSDTKEFVPKTANAGKFYERYTHLKNLRKVTDYAVAKACALRRGTVSKWKYVEGSPETTTLLKLAEYFNCSMNFLLGIATE